MKIKNDIQVLRGLSVIAVVVFHLFPNANNGYLGVDAFFVISGFLITPKILNILNDNNFSDIKRNLKKFYIKRFYRLTPALSVSIFTFSIIIFISGNTEEHSNILKQCLATLLMLGNVGAYTYNGDYFNPNPNPFTHAWSLSLEEQIYVFLPLVVIFFSFLFNKISVVTIFKILCTISFIFFISHELTIKLLSFLNITDYFSNLTYYSTLHRFWEFGIGGMCAILYTKFIYVNNMIKTIINLSILFILIWGCDNQILDTMFIVLLTGAAIVTESLNFRPNLISKLVSLTGNKSYSIYLVHFPIIYIVKYTFIFNVKNSILELLITVLLIFLTSLILSRFVEEKYRYSYRVLSTTYLSYKRAAIYFFILPTIVVVSQYYVSQNNYFDLVKKVEKPIAAWDVDKVCSNNIVVDPCKYGDHLINGSILLIGDSHAAHVSQTVRKVALNNKYGLFVWSYCDFQITDSRRMLDPNCIRHNSEVVSWINSNKPKVVIVSQRMHATTSFKDMEIALNKLKILTSNVILIGNNPVFSDSSKFMKTSLLIRYHPDKQVLLGKMDQDSLIAADRFKALTRKLKIPYVDTKDIFCTADVCKRFENGNWLYWDAGHLSVYGAALLENDLESLINNVQ
jgi:peptidoglycan/LPS O-acetylase OafA/YrhL